MQFDGSVSRIYSLPGAGAGCVRPVGPRRGNYALGGMFWFCENRFAGSYLVFKTDNRSKLGP